MRMPVKWFVAFLWTMRTSHTCRRLDCGGAPPVLEHNIFEFNGQSFSQRHRVAMGTKLAPTLATLYLAQIEEEFLRGRLLRPLVWFRFIDNIFAVWSYDRPALDLFLADLNVLQPRLRFTATISATEVVFLDLVVYKSPTFVVSGRLDSRLHQKPTRHMAYVRGQSYHPQYCDWSDPTSPLGLLGVCLVLCRTGAPGATF